MYSHVQVLSRSLSISKALYKNVQHTVILGVINFKFFPEKQVT